MIFGMNVLTVLLSIFLAFFTSLLIRDLYLGYTSHWNSGAREKHFNAAGSLLLPVIIIGFFFGLCFYEECDNHELIFLYNTKGKVVEIHNSEIWHNGFRTYPKEVELNRSSIRQEGPFRATIKVKDMYIYIEAGVSAKVTWIANVRKYQKKHHLNSETFFWHYHDRMRQAAEEILCKRPNIGSNTFKHNWKKRSNSYLSIMGIEITEVLIYKFQK